MSYKRKSLLFKYGNELLKSPLLFIDVGARGNLSQPFADIRMLMPNLLKVIAFEPDSSAAQQVVSNLEGELIFNKAAWSKSEKLTLHVTKDESASSMFKPNWAAAETFQNEHMAVREVVATQTVEGVALDEMVSGIDDLGGSFLKCDTQGSEFELVSGAQDYLGSNCIGLTMECWTQPVYEGTHTVDEVITLVRKLGFEIFDIQVSAAWNRRISAKSLERKKQVVGLDFLAFKNLNCFYSSNPSEVEIIRFVLFADLWGYADYALQILNHESCTIENVLRKEIIEKISNIRKSRKFENKKFIFHKDLIRRKFGICPRFPLIH